DPGGKTRGPSGGLAARDRRYRAHPGQGRLALCAPKGPKASPLRADAAPAAEEVAKANRFAAPQVAGREPRSASRTARTAAESAGRQPADADPRWRRDRGGLR